MTTYELTPDEHYILEALCRWDRLATPEPPHDVAPMWRIVAARVGCKVDTIGPTPGKNSMYFDAEPL